ncbi:hypothetical protein LXA43DRAFT_1162762 [Ganoderma leucocontextum]|nr:hypothetical protein LXA43DRAFT_1162762 [Ganoderma leucocontextum]
MPVTFQVANHDAKPITRRHQEQKTTEDFLKVLYRRQWKAGGEMLQSSVTESSLQTLELQKNGFVHTVVEAYGQHHHLRIRVKNTDRIRLSLASSEFSVNKHAEELRSYFVAHEVKKEIYRVETFGTQYTVDFGVWTLGHTDVVDSTLVEWILPDFTTSTPHDATICSVLLMSTLQAYFSYTMMCICGIPSVTLEGENLSLSDACKAVGCRVSCDPGDQ